MIFGGFAFIAIAAMLYVFGLIILLVLRIIILVFEGIAAVLFKRPQRTEIETHPDAPPTRPGGFWMFDTVRRVWRWFPNPPR